LSLKIEDAHLTEVFHNAATLLLVRPAGDDFEVFMVERPGAADFGGLHVFPGGKVDDSDADLEPYCIGLTDARASAALGVGNNGLRFWVAAIREAFEEAGVLLAYEMDEEGGHPIDFSGDNEARFDQYRREVHQGFVTMADLCHREGLRLAADRVHYFSHWITPKGPPRRYDTRFFLAVAPEDQELAHHEDELEGGEWVRPAEALGHVKSGRWQMITPTLWTLETMADYDGIEALVDDMLEGKHLPEVTEARLKEGMQPSYSR
jgi:8-oxo-dGTP pyrophosphatase MutT (NUDIX family)